MGGEPEDAQPVREPALLNRIDDLPTVHARHADVEHHQIHDLRVEAGEGLEAGRRSLTS